MNDLELINTAISLSGQAHEKQFRRDNVTPYYRHVLDVVRRVDQSSPEQIATAYLHDVLEDSTMTSFSLKEAGLPEGVIHAVMLLSHSPNDSYTAYLDHLKHDELARKVKIADMISNLADDPTDQQIKKYGLGLHFLLS